MIWPNANYSRKLDAAPKVDRTKLVKDADGRYEVQDKTKPKKKLCGCCCAGHCYFSRGNHRTSGRVVGSNLSKLEFVPTAMELEFPSIFERDLQEAFDIDDLEEMEVVNGPNDEILDMMLAMGTNFSLEN